MVAPNTKYFVELLNSVYAIRTDVFLEFDENGMTVSTVDEARVALAELQASHKIFEEYECPEPIKIAVALWDIIHALSRAKSSEALTLVIENETINLKMVKGNGVEKQYSFHLVKGDLQDLPKPSFEWRAYAKLAARELKEAIKDFKIFNSQVSITITPEELRLTTTGDNGNALIKYVKGSSHLSELRADGEETAMFSINYLDRIAKAGEAVSDVVEINMLTNKPIKLVYPIPEGQVSYLLAPIIGA